MGRASAKDTADRERLDVRLVIDDADTAAAIRRSARENKRTIVNEIRFALENHYPLSSGAAYAPPWSAAKEKGRL